MPDALTWDKLKVTRFRGLADLELADLGAFNVIVGANNVGKTSCLEAVFLVSGSANISLPIRVQNIRDFIVRDIEGLYSLFYDLDVTHAIDLSAETNDPRTYRRLVVSAPAQVANVDVESTPLVGIPTSSSSPSTSRMLRYDLTIANSDDDAPRSHIGTLVHEGDKFIPTMDSDSIPNSIVLARFIHDRSSYDANPIADAIVNKRADMLLEYLRIVDPRIESVTTSGSLAYLDIGLDKMLPMNMFGSGMIRACSIISHLVQGNYKILLVDELEKGLHHEAIPPLLEALLRVSRDKEIQVYVTTHSLGILEGLADVLAQSHMAEYRESSACYTLARDRDGVVRSYRYSYPDFRHCLVHGIEIR